MDLQPVGNLGDARPEVRNAAREHFEFWVGRGQPIAISHQEKSRRRGPGALVSIYEWMIVDSG